jgi:hypothetical protein
MDIWYPLYASYICARILFCCSSHVHISIKILRKSCEGIVPKARKLKQKELENRPETLREMLLGPFGLQGESKASPKADLDGQRDAKGRQRDARRTIFQVRFGDRIHKKTKSFALRVSMTRFTDSRSIRELVLEASGLQNRARARLQKPSKTMIRMPKSRVPAPTKSRKNDIAALLTPTPAFFELFENVLEPRACLESLGTLAKIPQGSRVSLRASRARVRGRREARGPHGGGGASPSIWGHVLV